MIFQGLTNLTIHFSTKLYRLIYTLYLKLYRMELTEFDEARAIIDFASNKSKDRKQVTLFLIDKLISESFGEEAVKWRYVREIIETEMQSNKCPCPVCGIGEKIPSAWECSEFCGYFEH